MKIIKILPKSKKTPTSKHNIKVKTISTLKNEHLTKSTDYLEEQYLKTPFKNQEGIIEKKLGDDLDVPGAELDDKEEEIGSEDEENNYYSIGGENHSD